MDARLSLTLPAMLKDATVTALEADKGLPEAVKVEAPTKVKNPFG